MSEYGRRLVHVSGTGLPALYLLDLVTWSQLQLLLLASLVVALLLEFVRLFVGLDLWVYRELTREYEQDNPAGYALYFVSLAVVGLLFSPPVAIPGMLMLTIGDPVSGILGSGSSGRVKPAGVLAAMFAVCFALAFPFVAGVESLPVAVLAAAVGAAGATLADGVHLTVATYVVDDNLSIPPAACVGIAAVLWVLG